MYENIGGKIKMLAVWTAILGIASSVAFGFYILIDEEEFFGGLLIAVLGSLVSWVSTWLLYGFGELIEKVTEIAYNTRGGGSAKVKSEAQQQVDYERIKKIEKLRAQGLITEEEYQKAISKVQ